MTIPRRWRWPLRAAFDKDPISYLDDMYSDLAEEIAAPNWRLNRTEVIAPTATSFTVVTDIDRLPFQVSVSTSWDTRTWITAKSVTGFIVNFGTAAPGGGGAMDWTVVQSEPGPA